MRIFSVMGSPNRKGNTATLLQQYLEGIKENHSDIESTNIYLEDMNISGCKGCNACKIRKLEGCVIKDDMNELYRKLKNSDALILATPIYFFSMTSQLKAFIDRLYALDFNTWKGKKIVLLTTYGDTDEISSGAVNAINIVEYMARFSGMDFVQRYGVSTGTSTVSENSEALEQVYQLGKEL